MGYCTSLLLSPLCSVSVSLPAWLALEAAKEKRIREIGLRFISGKAGECLRSGHAHKPPSIHLFIQPFILAKPFTWE